MKTSLGNIEFWKMFEKDRFEERRREFKGGIDHK